MSWQVIIIAVIILAMAVAGIAVKIFFKKGYTFQKHCTSKDAGKNEACVCKGNEKECKYRDLHYPDNFKTIKDV